MYSRYRRQGKLTDIKRIEIDPALKTANVSYDFDISGYSDGAYYIRGIAYDKAGNVSAGKFFVEYRIDTTPPMSPSGVKGESTEEKSQFCGTEAMTKPSNIIMYTEAKKRRNIYFDKRGTCFSWLCRS